MKVIIIATWSMAFDAVKNSHNILLEGGSSLDAIERGIREVEDNINYTSVGYGGFPNKKGEVELDAGIMCGSTMSVGSVACVKNYGNPISIAKKLMNRHTNIFLVGKGAELFAKNNGFKRKRMLTKKARLEWKKKRKAFKNDPQAYDGHDTVGMIAVDKEGRISSGTSTSGLFMKDPGRMGDSPIVGSGFYADSRYGGATATGLGEDIMKGVLSYEVVRLMSDGHSPQEASKIAISKFSNHLKKASGIVDDISVIALNNKGEWGAATNAKQFSFVVSEGEGDPTVYISSFKDGKTKTVKATQEWIDSHLE